MKKIIFISLITFITLVIFSCENNIALEDNALKNLNGKDTISVDTTEINYRKVIITTVVTQKDTIRDTVYVTTEIKEETSKGILLNNAFLENHDLKNNKDIVQWFPDKSNGMNATIKYSLGKTMLDFDCYLATTKFNFDIGFKKLEAVKKFKIGFKANLYELLDIPFHLNDQFLAQNSFSDIVIITKDSAEIKNPFGSDVGLRITKIVFDGYKVKELGIYFAVVLPSADTRDMKYSFFSYEGEMIFKFE